MLHELVYSRVPIGELDPAKSPLAEACRYALNRWGALGRFATDGNLEIDNNAAERALRCVALGRNNYLFLGSDAGASRAANFYTLIGTARLNGVEPEAYLRHVRPNAMPRR